MRDRLKSLNRFRVRISSRFTQRNDPLLVSATPMTATTNYQSLNLGSAEESCEEEKVHLQDFLDNISSLRQGITELQTLLSDIRVNHSLLLTEPSQEGILRVNESALAQFRTKAAWISGSLKNLQSTVEFQSDGSPSSVSHHGERWTAMSKRIRQTQFDGLSQQFKEVMEEFSAILDEYRCKSREAAQRKLSLVKEDFTAEQVENMLDNPHTQLVSDEILLEEPQLQQALQEIELRNAELKLLHNTMEELRDMFVIMSALTQEQGATVDQIEHYVDGAGDYIHSGMRQAQISTIYRRRNKKLCVVICAVSLPIISVVLVLIIVIVTIIIYRYADKM